MLHLESTRIVIRNLKEEDLDAFVSYRSVPEIAKYQGYDVLNKKSAFEFILSHKEDKLLLPGYWSQFAIIEKASCKLIGDCAICLKMDLIKSAEISCTISPLWQKQGYARETLNVLINYLINFAGVHKIQTVIDAENVASINLMKTLNFVKEGEEIVKFKGNWCKEINYYFKPS